MDVRRKAGLSHPRQFGIFRWSSWLVRQWAIFCCSRAAENMHRERREIMALYAFDGTWNEDEIGEKHDTNVAKFFNSYQGRKFYLKGVGTRAGFVGKILGGVAGAGGRFRIREAMEELEKNLARGERVVDIIGFSRGAALALHFANEIAEEQPGIDVRFLGLWDVVASFGLPGNDLNIGWHLTLPGIVHRCCHAMALDERRGNFQPTRVKAGEGDPPVEGRLEEVWFRGVHSDVGGGMSIGLSSIALCWLMRRALDSGLPVDPSELQRFEALRDPEADISENFDPKLDPPRTIGSTDKVHVSVQPRGSRGGKEHNDPPPGLTIVND